MMSEETVTVTIKGVKHFFHGNELISATQEAISFLIKIADEEVEF